TIQPQSQTSSPSEAPPLYHTQTDFPSVRWYTQRSRHPQPMSAPSGLNALTSRGMEDEDSPAAGGAEAPARFGPEVAQTRRRPSIPLAHICLTSRDRRV